MAEGFSKTSKSEDVERVWELMDKIGYAMLATHDGNAIRARPMGAYVREDDNRIYFLTDVSGVKDDEIRANPEVCLTFSDKGAGKHVSLSGTAEVSNDRAKIKELWNPVAKAWWDSAEDPNIRVLKINPSEAQYWDSPGKLVATVIMAAAAVAGKRPDLGENKKVDL